jgi:hypothetical protein
MERLRIELPGKGFSLLLVDYMRSAGEALAHEETVEIEPLVRVLHVNLEHVTPTFLRVTRNAGVPASYRQMQRTLLIKRPARRPG